MTTAKAPKAHKAPVKAPEKRSRSRTPGPGQEADTGQGSPRPGDVATFPLSRPGSFPRPRRKRLAEVARGTNSVRPGPPSPSGAPAKGAPAHAHA